MGCNTTRVIKPLDKGEKQVSASIGGPAIIFGGMPIPLPLSSVNYAHGLDTGITLAVGLHSTSAAFGVLQSDIGLGISAFRSKGDRFGITVTPMLNLMYDFGEDNGRIYPQLDLMNWWQYGKKPHLFYGGVGTWIELVKAKAHGQVQENEFMPWVTLGHQFNFEKWSYLAEVKYLGFQHNTGTVVVDYISPANQGVIGVYLGVSRKF
jgi:hypothetical protein